MCWLKGKESIFLVLVAVTLTTCPTWTLAEKTLFDELNRHNDIKEFFQEVNKSRYIKTALEFKSYTLFAPTNDAIKEYRAKDGAKMDEYILNYHMTNLAVNLNETGDSVSSELSGHPPIWVTQQNGDTYLNDAKVIKGPMEARAGDGSKQYLYLIDRVLEPAIPTTSNPSLFNPDAKKYLEQHSQYSITKGRALSNFARRVVEVQQDSLLKSTGKNTFFIPIDEALKKESVKSAITDKVAAGHVIPNEAVFLRLAKPGEEFKTAAMALNFEVFASIENRTGADGKNIWMVQSNTKLADAGHRTGIVQTEVLIGNIPVKNGVVHIISKPLVVIDETVHQTLLGGEDDSSENETESSSYEWEAFAPRGGSADQTNGGLMQQFVNVFRDKARDLFDQLVTGGETTVFVPSNEAIGNVEDSLNKMDASQLQEILKLHIVKAFISTDIIQDRHVNTSGHYQVESLAPGKKLLLNFVDGNPRTYYVEGRGVNATITKPNIAATDGVIHIINKVLGFADVSVYEKLSTDPMLSKTFELTSQENINERFKNKDVKFTIFAPNNEAWNNIYNIAPSEHKKLMSGNYGYHVGVIFRRHTIVGQVLTIEELYNLTKNNTRLPTISGNVEVKYRNETGIGKYDMDTYPRQRVSNNFDYVLYWNYQHARVIRPNINCTNGIIHIIDHVLMRPEDVTVASGSSVQSIFTTLISSALLTLLLLN